MFSLNQYNNCMIVNLVSPLHFKGGAKVMIAPIPDHYLILSFFSFFLLIVMLNSHVAVISFYYLKFL